MKIDPTATSDTVILAPRFNVPTGVAIVALLAYPVSVWLTAVLIVFAVFLAIQAATLRLHFTPSSLAVWRGTTLIRDFPYQNWQTWEIYWPRLPILFYFREVNSIHFLPMLFDARALQTQLTTYVPTATPDPVQ